MTSHDPDFWQTLHQSEALTQIKREKNRLSLTLLLIGATYYAVLLLGPTSLKALFSLPIAGELNFGTAFAVSQYPFCGVLALVYVTKMRSIDVQIANLVQRHTNGAAL